MLVTKHLPVLLVALWIPLASYTVGIVSATPSEVGALKEQMTDLVEETSPGGRASYQGTLYGIDTVITHARMGKVASALAVTELIGRHSPDLIIFVGVAGAADPTLSIGDVVVADSLMQHDMDCRPFIPRYAVPLIGKDAFCPPPELTALALEATNRFLASGLPADVSSQFGIERPRATLGLVATGDKVFADRGELAALRDRLPGIACVEMEGAAAGQVAYEYGIPILVIRTISDVADESAHIDIRAFMGSAAGVYAEGIIRELFPLLSESDHFPATLT